MIPGAWFPYLVAGGKVITGGGGAASLESSFGPIVEFVHDNTGQYHLTLRGPGIPSFALHNGFCIVSCAQTGNIATAIVTTLVTPTSSTVRPIIGPRTFPPSST